MSAESDGQWLQVFLERHPSPLSISLCLKIFSLLSVLTCTLYYLSR